MTSEQLLSRLERVKRAGPGQWVASCPCEIHARGDRRPSLRIKEADDKLLLHCHAGCEAKDVVKALGLTMRDLSSGSRDLSPSRPRPPGSGSIYQYRDEAGALLFEVVRSPQKEFRQRRPDPGARGGWSWNLDGVRRVLYRLPEMLTASLNEQVFVVEGEKDVESVRSLGLTATTNPGGTGSAKLWRQADFTKALRGRRVVVLPDNDGAGRKHARQVAEALAGLAASVRILELPDLPSKGDVTDWINDGGSRAKLLELAKAAPPLEPSGARPDDEQEPDYTDRDRPPPQSHRLIELAQQCSEVFNVPLGSVPGNEGCFATFQLLGVQQTWPVDSSIFRGFLFQRFHEAEGRYPTQTSLTEALHALKYIAATGTDKRAVHLRVAEAGEKVFIDLADDSWKVVEIDGGGWRVVDASAAPVRFRRSDAMRPLPEPARGGSLDELRAFVNCPDDESWRLMLAFLMFTFVPGGPFPLMVITGEQGSSKSTTTKILRSLIDPSELEVRSLPEDEKELLIGALSTWMLCFDNLSGLSSRLADHLCRLSTGMGIGTRKHYTNFEESFAKATRAVIVNGIDEMIRRGDFADRVVAIKLPAISPEQRREEGELWRDFEAARPRIFGALCSGVARALAERPRVQATNLPRMADFARWGIAVERSQRWPDGSFLSDYRANLGESFATVVEGDPVALGILAIVDLPGTLAAGSWTGLTSELLRALQTQVPPDRRGRYWPQSPQALTSHLKRACTMLRAAGIEVKSLGRTKRGSEWLIRPSSDVPESSSPLPPLPPGQSFRAVPGDEVGDEVGFGPGSRLQPGVATGGNGESHQKFATPSVGGNGGKLFPFPTGDTKEEGEGEDQPVGLPAPGRGSEAESP